MQSAATDCQSAITTLRCIIYLLVDTGVQQLDERFHGNSSLLKHQALENMLLTEKCGNVAVDLSVYEYIDWPNLQIQLELFRRRRSINCVSDAVDILKGMSPSYVESTAKWRSWYVCFSSRLYRPQKMNAVSPPFVG